MRFWDITWKDLLLLVRDARALFLLVALPLVFITIIGLTTGRLMGWQSSNQILKIGVIDRIDYDAVDDELDRRIARNITTKIINGLRDGRGRRIVVLPADADPNVELQDDDEFDAILEIGPDFFTRYREIELEDASGGSESILRNDGMTGLNMTVHSNLPRNSGTRSIIEELLAAQTLKTLFPYVLCEKFRTSSGVVNVQIQRRMNCYELRSETVEQAEPSAELDADAAGDEVYQVLIPSYTVLFVFFLVNIMARSFLHERDLGTLRRLRIAPVSRASLIAGKTIPFLVVSLVQTALLFLCGKLLFGMAWGPHPAMLLPVIFATSLSATGLGLLVATMVRSDSQVSAYATIIVISMAGFSGCFMPRDWLPEAMQTASLATPHAWALMCYEQLLVKETPDLSLVWQYCGMLVLFAAAYFAVGAVLFRRYD